MYIGYRLDRQYLGFKCIKDIEAGNLFLEIELKIGIFCVGITILINSHSFIINNFDSIDQAYFNKVCHERVVSNVNLNVTNQNSDTLKLITGLRCGADYLEENPNQNLEKINDSLKESARSEKLQENVIVKSLEDSNSWSDYSLNKIITEIFKKLEPIIGNPKFLRILSETQKPVKSEISVQLSSKQIIGPKTEKNSPNRNFPIFAEAIVPINPGKWPVFTAGSAMSSDMPDLQDKIKTPLNNLVISKEYLETSKSDAQWRYRLWKIAEDTTAINFSSELGGNLGTFAAGAASNKIADKYMDERVMNEISKNPQDEINHEMFKQVAREKGMDVSEVRGTGLKREFVPDFMQEDVCNRPESDSRPNFWEDNTSRYDDERYFN